LAQVVVGQGHETVNFGVRTEEVKGKRSHEAKVILGDPTKASFSNPLVDILFCVYF